MNSTVLDGMKEVNEPVWMRNTHICMHGEKVSFEST